MESDLRNLTSVSIPAFVLTRTTLTYPSESWIFIWPTSSTAMVSRKYTYLYRCELAKQFFESHIPFILNRTYYASYTLRQLRLDLTLEKKQSTTFIRTMALNLKSYIHPAKYVSLSAIRSLNGAR